MKLGDFLTLKALLAFLFAAGALLVPGLLIVFHGGQSSSMAEAAMRYYGAMLLGIGLICWFLRNAEASQARRNILLALFIADTLGLITALLALGTLNFLGWVDAAIWLILVLGLAYYRFLQPQAM